MVLLALSGMATLTYQVVWVRLLGLSLGVSTEAISTVLAAFFFGLALGSAAAPRLLRRGNALGWFVAAEGAIGLSGLALLPVLPNLGQAVSGWPVPDLLASFSAAFALLLLPTFCMGLSFPVMATAVLQRSDRLGFGLGSLYAANTVGAVLGASLSGFWWIPAVGLDGACFLAAGVNALIVVLGLAALARRVPTAPTTSAADLPGADSGAPPGNVGGNVGGNAPGTDQRDVGMERAALLVLAATGFVSIATEVAWTKYLVLLTGGTVYGFSTILTVFLIGLALGSAAVRARLDRIRSPETWMVVGLLLLGGSLLWARTALTLLPSVLAVPPGAPPVAAAVRLIAVAVVLLPPTFLFGAVFPLSLRLYCGTLTRMRSDLGGAYAVNTVAGVLGSVVTGFWWIPRYGTNAVLTGTAFLILLLPIALLRRAPSRRVRSIAALGAAAALLWTAFGPGLRYDRMIATVRYAHDDEEASGKPPTFLFLREGHTGVVSVTTYDGRFAHLQNNGLKESRLDLEHPAHGPLAETLLGLLPVALHGAARSCFLVGYGGGVTARALLHTDLPSIRVVELEAAIPEAIRSVLGGDARLDDPRLALHIGDARHELAASDQRYDLVISQPSHPWRAGASALFTREFFQLVRSRLADDGVFGQWINLFNMDSQTLLSVTKTFFDTFPHGFVLTLADTGDLLLFGSPRPLSLDPQDLERMWAHPDARSTLVASDLRDPFDLLERFAWSRREALTLAADSEWNTDLNMRSEVRLAAMTLRAAPQEGGHMNPYALLKDTTSFDLQPFLTEARAAPVAADLARRFLQRGELPSARRLIEGLEATDPTTAADLAGELSNGFRTAAPPAYE